MCARELSFLTLPLVCMVHKQGASTALSDGSAWAVSRPACALQALKAMTITVTTDTIPATCARLAYIHHLSLHPALHAQQERYPISQGRHEIIVRYVQLDLTARRGTLPALYAGPGRTQLQWGTLIRPRASYALPVRIPVWQVPTGVLCAERALLEPSLGLGRPTAQRAHLAHMRRKRVHLCARLARQATSLGLVLPAAPSWASWLTGWTSGAPADPCRM